MERAPGVSMYQLSQLAHPTLVSNGAAKAHCAKGMCILRDPGPARMIGAASLG
jgi:hypothetical protein